MIHVVVKVGGSLLREPPRLARAIDALNTRPAGLRLVIVPGGGLFADAVRAVDQQLDIGPDTAHWMAVFATHQFGQLLQSRLDHSALVESQQEIEKTLDEGLLPIVLPYRWLQASDHLEGTPSHSWDSTSDSIAAWIAGQLNAPTLILVKLVSATDDNLSGLVDREFRGQLRLGTTAHVATPEQLADTLRRYAPAPSTLASRATHTSDIGAEGLDER